MAEQPMDPDDELGVPPNDHPDEPESVPEVADDPVTDDPSLDRDPKAKQ